jgi:FkbM family methyltransferase
MAKCINGWWFPDDDIGPSTHADCAWGEPILNAQMFPIIENAFRSRAPQHVLDIGANIGYVTSWFARRWPRVTSFEPTPATFDCLMRNCSKGHIELHNIGISDVNGELCFAVSDVKPDQNQIITNESRLKKRWGMTRIPVRRIDSFGFRIVDMIKIDVEGHEYQVIQGALRTIQRCRPAIMIEISYEGKLLDHDITAQHKNTVSVIESLGYTIHWQLKHDWFLLPNEWPDHGQ